MICSLVNYVIEDIEDVVKTVKTVSLSVELPQTLGLLSLLLWH